MGLNDLPILDLFKKLVPQTDGHSEEVLEILLELAVNQTSKKVFGTSYRPAVCYLAGHYLLLSIERRGGASGPITARRAGEVAENFGNVIPTADGLNQTSYGQLYLFIQRRRPRISPMSTKRFR